MKKDLTRLWGRFGISLDATPAEVEVLLCGTDSDREKALMAIFASGRAVFDGESYFPGPAIEDYNNDYGTYYEEGDIEFESGALGEKPLRLNVRGTEAEKHTSLRHKERGEER